METKGINSDVQIDKEKSCDELRMKSMMNSCFAYGEYEKDSYQYLNYIEPFRTKLGNKLFEEVYKEQSEFLKKCTINHGVYTDFEGCTYNSINFPK